MPPALLFALSALACSANLLDSFTPFTDKFPRHNIAFTKHYVYESYSFTADGDNPVAVESFLGSCAKRCLSVMNFGLCRSFTVTLEIQTQAVQCLAFRTKSSEITYSIDDASPNDLLAVYDARDKLVEDIVAKILNDPELLQGPQLLIQHGLSPQKRADHWDLMLDLLRLCETALHAKPPTHIDFDKWVGGETIAGSQRKSVDHCISSTARRPSATCVRITENVSSAPLSTLVLTFLDLITQGPGIITIFDPLKRTLFIEGQDVHILVVSFGYGEFAVARFDQSELILDHSGLIDIQNQEIPLEIHYFFILTSDHNDDWDSAVLEMYDKAMSRFGHKAKFFFPPVSSFHCQTYGGEEYSGFETVLGVLSSRRFSKLDALQGTTNIKGKLIKGLMNAVVSSAYQNKQKSELLGSNIWRTLKVGSLADINIITTIPR